MTSRLSYTLRGLAVPVFTPFRNNSERSIYASLISRYSDHLKSKNVRCVVVNDTIGESATMSVKERKKIAEAWSDAAKRNNQHLIIQVGRAALPDVVDLAKHAQLLKVNGILYSPKPSDEERKISDVIQYLVKVAESAPETPLLYYHSPEVTKISTEELLKLADERIPNFVGIKFASTNLNEGLRASQFKDGKFVVFFNDNIKLISEASSRGFDSFMTSGANLFPETVQSIIESGKNGDHAKVKKLQKLLSQAFINRPQLGNSLNNMKSTMSRLSLIPFGPTRLQTDT